MSDAHADKAVLWIHGRTCRTIVLDDKGQVVDKFDNWNNFASAQAYVYQAFGFDVRCDLVDRADQSRVRELNTLFELNSSEG